jgi:hypothetical protein
VRLGNTRARHRTDKTRFCRLRPNDRFASCMVARVQQDATRALPKLALWREALEPHLKRRTCFKGRGAGRAWGKSRRGAGSPRGQCQVCHNLIRRQITTPDAAIAKRTGVTGS